MDRKSRVHLRVTEKEKGEFTAKAAAAGVALSEYLRKAALQIGVRAVGVFRHKPTQSSI